MGVFTLVTQMCQIQGTDHWINIIEASGNHLFLLYFILESNDLYPSCNKFDLFFTFNFSCFYIVTGIFIPFNQRFMAEASLLQAKCKPTSAAKQFKGINHSITSLLLQTKIHVYFITSR